MRINHNFCIKLVRLVILEILMLPIQNSFCCVYFIHLLTIELDGLPSVNFRVQCQLTSCEIAMNLLAHVPAFLPVSSDYPY